MTPEMIIAAIDQRLSDLREAWLTVPEKDKPRFMDRINAALDERLEAMEKRTP